MPDGSVVPLEGDLGELKPRRAETLLRDQFRMLGAGCCPQEISSLSGATTRPTPQGAGKTRSPAEPLLFLKATSALIPFSGAYHPRSPAERAGGATRQSWRWSSARTAQNLSVAQSLATWSSATPVSTTSPRATSRKKGGAVHPRQGLRHLRSAWARGSRPPLPPCAGRPRLLGERRGRGRTATPGDMVFESLDSLIFLHQSVCMTLLSGRCHRHRHAFRVWAPSSPATGSRWRSRGWGCLENPIDRQLDAGS